MSADAIDLDDELDNLFNEMESTIATIPVVKSVPVSPAIDKPISVVATRGHNFILPKSAEAFEHRVIDIVDTVYPNQWDYNSANKTLLIKFDNLIVTNSLNQRHHMRDLFVKVKFNSTGQLRDFSGTRATVTIPEYQSAYAFSHLSTSAAQGITWGGFCLGTGEIRNTNDRLHVDFDDIQFEMFLHALTDYLSWESIEGGPYVRLSSISFRSECGSISTTTKSDIYARYINKFSGKDLKYIITTNPFRIDIDSHDYTFGQNVLSVLPNKTRSSEQDNMIVYRDDITGQYFSKRYKDNVRLGHIGNYEESFKGERIKKQVINIHDEKSLKEYPNPEITRWIADRLARAINLQAIVKGASNSRNPKGLVIANVVLQDL